MELLIGPMKTWNKKIRIRKPERFPRGETKGVREWMLVLDNLIGSSCTFLSFFFLRRIIVDCPWLQRDRHSFFSFHWDWAINSFFRADFSEILLFFYTRWIIYNSYLSIINYIESFETTIFGLMRNNFREEFLNLTYIIQSDTFNILGNWRINKDRFVSLFYARRMHDSNGKIQLIERSNFVF